MPAIYHTNIISVVPHYDIGAPHDAVNVTHWQGSGWPFTIPQLAAVQAAFDPKWALLWKDLSTTGCRYLGSVVTDMSSNSGLQAGITSFTPVAGTTTFPVLSDGTAILISLKAAIRYRGGHGRIYLPGIGSGVTNNDGRTVVNTNVNNTNSAWDAVVAAMAGVSPANGGPFIPVLWHKHMSALPNSVEPVVNRATSNVLATQRRRLRKVSRHRRRLP